MNLHFIRIFKTAAKVLHFSKKCIRNLVKIKVGSFSEELLNNFFGSNVLLSLKSVILHNYKESYVQI